VKLVVIVISAAILCCSTVSSQTTDKKSGDESKALQQVLAMNNVWAEAITKGDAAALDRLFADDMIATTASAQIRDKSGEIKDATGSPDPDFAWVHPFTTQDVRVKIYKDAAVVIGIAKWGFKYKGQAVDHQRRYTHLYVKQHGQWRIVAQQMSADMYKK
jgi:hypothetical protein